jgi:putative colanic acid biosynthesis acetyltransferase WcaF
MYNKDTHTEPSFSLKNRLARVVWNITYYIFFRLSPVPFHAWRSFLLRCFGAKIGKGVHVYPAVKIWAPWNIEIGDQSGIASRVILYSQGKIKIGKQVVISQGSNICTGTHDYLLKGFPLITKPIIIDDEVWIAAETFVHPGIHIHEGAVIGARSVVTKDMPAWMICAGHPCQPLKKREQKEASV